MTGHTPGRGKILLLLDPSRENIEEKLAYTLAHEYYHSTWFKGYEGQAFKLLDYLVFEGKADAFASRVFPTYKPPWLSGLSKAGIESLYSRLSDYLDVTEREVLHQVMFGGHGFPISGGYVLGSYLLECFIKEGGTADWSRACPSQILKALSFDDQ